MKEVIGWSFVVAFVLGLGWPWATESRSEYDRPHSLSGARRLVQARLIYSHDADSELQIRDNVAREGRTPRYALGHLALDAEHNMNGAWAYVAPAALYDDLARRRHSSCSSEKSARFGLGLLIFCCKWSGNEVPCVECFLLEPPEVFRCLSGDCEALDPDHLGPCVSSCPPPEPVHF